MQKQLDSRIRRNLEAIRDEFRLLYLKHPPLIHERFTSPLEVDRSGWQAFSKEILGEEGYRTYVAPGGQWLGAFSGSGIDLKTSRCYRDFLKICHELGLLLFRIPISSLQARSDWLDIVHDLAELGATPTLRGSRTIWFNDGLVEYETDSELTKMWDERGNLGIKFPKYPEVGSLGRDVFRASAMAIDILLDPEEFFVWRRRTEETLPFDLADITTRSPAIVPSQQSQQESMDVPVRRLPDFLFAKTGNVWKIRYGYGDSPENKEFYDTKGFDYYYRILQSGQKGVSSLELSPTGTESEDDRSLRTVSSLSEVVDEWNDDEFSPNLSESSPLFQSVESEDYPRLKILKKELEEGIDQLKGLEDKNSLEQIKLHRKELRNLNRAIRTGLLFDDHDNPDFKAFNRVKAALRRARLVISRDMPIFGSFLQESIKPYDGPRKLDHRLR